MITTDKAKGFNGGQLLHGRRKRRPFEAVPSNLFEVECGNEIASELSHLYAALLF